MATKSDILISVEERHAKNLLSGTKKMELRRRKINVKCGDRVWIYSKVPKGTVEAIGHVSSVFSASPVAIWEKFSESVGLSEIEFFEYYADLDMGHAIIFSKVLPLKNCVDLKDIRRHYESFQPPQFFQRLNAASPVLQLFEAAHA